VKIGGVEGIVVHRTAGERITDREGREVTTLAAHDDISIHWYRLAPGETGPGAHVHHEHTDAFYVLEGELSFALGPDRESVSVGAGGLVAAPPNVVHTFANESGGEVRFLNLHAPDGGFAAYMRARRDGDEDASFDSFDPPPDGGRPLGDAVVSRPGEGERLEAKTRTALLKAVLQDLCLIEFDLFDGFAGPRVHEHDDQVDSFYVLDGEVEMTLEDSRQAIGPETLASVPRGVRHTFAHTGPGAARVLNIHAPDAGFGEFMRTA
jgi:mannose-6-phosphate isomerase-like protein (cupin superfamily)